MSYRLEGHTLHVSGSLSEPLNTELDLHASMLLQQDARKFVIDLSDVEYEYMGSWCLGFLADVGMKANMESKRLKLVASGAVAKTMKLAGLDRLIELEVRD